MSTLKATYLQHMGSPDPNITLDNTGGVTFNSGVVVSGFTELSGDININGGLSASGTVESYSGLYVSGMAFQNFLDGTLTQAAVWVDNAIVQSGTIAAHGLLFSNIDVNNENITNFNCVKIGPIENYGNVNELRAFNITNSFASGTPPVGVDFNARVLGFKSTLQQYTGSGTGEVWNFYNNGTAPNLMMGGLQFDETHSTGGTQEQLQLDYYEEGTFTVQISDSLVLASGNTGSLNSQQCTYTRIGRLVHVCLVLQNFDTTGMIATAALRIHGMPFSNPGSTIGVGIPQTVHLNYDEDAEYISVNISGGNGIATLVRNRPNLTATNLQVSGYNTNTELRFTMEYEVND